MYTHLQCTNGLLQYIKKERIPITFKNDISLTKPQCKHTYNATNGHLQHMTYGLYNKGLTKPNVHGIKITGILWFTEHHCLIEP